MLFYPPETDSISLNYSYLKTEPFILMWLEKLWGFVSSVKNNQVFMCASFGSSSFSALEQIFQAETLTMTLLQVFEKLKPTRAQEIGYVLIYHLTS